MQLNERGRQALLTINRALAEGASSQDAFNVIVHEAVNLCQAERGYLIRSDGEVVAAIPEHHGFSKGVVEMLIQSGEPLLTVDAAGDPRLDTRQSIMDEAVRSIIAAPLRGEESVVGVIYLDTSGNRRSFTQEDLDMLAALADQAVLAFRLAELNLQLEEQTRTAQEMSQLASTDELTGLENRRGFVDSVRQRLELPTTRALSLMMIDVDDFKLYNDKHGHLAGDSVLRKLAVILKRNLRDRDKAARYGGEEFIVALPNTSITVAKKVAERLRRAVSEATFGHGDKQPLEQVSVSIGLSVFPYHGQSFEELLQAADTALYDAKRKGKNRVVVQA